MDQTSRLGRRGSLRNGRLHGRGAALRLGDGAGAGGSGAIGGLSLQLLEFVFAVVGERQRAHDERVVDGSSAELRLRQSAVLVLHNKKLHV